MRRRTALVRPKLLLVVNRLRGANRPRGCRSQHLAWIGTGDSDEISTCQARTRMDDLLHTGTSVQALQPATTLPYDRGKETRGMLHEPSSHGFIMTVAVSLCRVEKNDKQALKQAGAWRAQSSTAPGTSPLVLMNFSKHCFGHVHAMSKTKARNLKAEGQEGHTWARSVTRWKMINIGPLLSLFCSPPPPPPLPTIGGA